MRGETILDLAECGEFRQALQARPPRVVHGTLVDIEAVLTATATGTVINTAYIERLNATFRAHPVPLTRRGPTPENPSTTQIGGPCLIQSLSSHDNSCL